MFEYDELLKKAHEAVIKDLKAEYIEAILVYEHTVEHCKKFLLICNPVLRFAITTKMNKYKQRTRVLKQHLYLKNIKIKYLYLFIRLKKNFSQDRVMEIEKLYLEIMELIRKVTYTKIKNKMIEKINELFEIWEKETISLFAKEDFHEGNTEVINNEKLSLNILQKEFSHYESLKIIFQPILCIMGLNAIELIMQKYVMDCSFVCAYISCINHEQKFKCNVITNNIKSIGDFFLVKFFKNGKWIFIQIDDKIPVNSKNKMLCSNTKNLPFVMFTIFEKAFLATFNFGYNLFGSDGANDIYAMTAWIPQIIFLEKSTRNEISNVANQFIKGNAMITLATANLTKKTRLQAGVVEKHCYCILDMVEFDREIALKLKNPWAKNSPKIKPQFKNHETIKYVNKNTKTYESGIGIFWIDYNILMNYFYTLNVNWNPKMYKYSKQLNIVGLFQE